MNDMLVILARWQLDVKAVRERLYGAPTPRECERRHAIWLLVRSSSAAQVVEALERDAHTIGAWAEDLRQQGPAGLVFKQSGSVPPPAALDPAQQAELKAAVEVASVASDISLANWNWKVVRQFSQERSGRVLSRISCGTSPSASPYGRRLTGPHREQGE